MVDAAGIAQSLAEIRARIERACAQSGRDPRLVTLVAVSKTHPPESIRAAYEAGQRDFGENYAQELAAKRAALADLTELRWHFIGALQSNKAKLVVPGCELVHAVDRESVAEALGRRAAAAGVVAEALVEVNVGDESSKAGVPIDQAEALVRQWSNVPSLRLRGLMCVPPPCDTPDDARPYFRRLRTLRDTIGASWPGLDLLLMGMSGGFEAAVAEGSTHVRVGSAIFGARVTVRETR